MNFLLKKLILFLAGLAVAATSCTQKRDLSQNTVIVHILAEPKGLHPTNDNNAYQRMIFMCTQSRLMTFDMVQNKTVPDLLAKPPELLPDSLSYRCLLRDDIKWDDGSPATIEDVIFTFKLIVFPLINNPDQKAFFENFRELIPDPLHNNGFIVINKKRYFDNEGALSQVCLLQKKYWDPSGLLDQFSFTQLTGQDFSGAQSAALEAFASSFNHADNARNPQKLQGLGPYKVSSWQTGNSITLERKNNWWGKGLPETFRQAWPEKIIFTVIKDMEAVVLALKKENIDVSMELSTAALKKLQKRSYFNNKYTSDFIGSFSYTYMGMNMKPEGSRPAFFTDKLVRKAMAHLVPVDEIIQVSAKGVGKRIASFGLPGQVDYNADLMPPAFDIEKAKKLLDAAGWKDLDGDNIREKTIKGVKQPFSFALSYMVSPVTREIALLIRNAMYQAGIDARPDPMDFSVFYERAARHDFDAMLGSWSASAGPEDPRQLWHTSNWANHGSNFTGFGNTYTDSLIQQMNKELNPAKRKQMMMHFQALVAEEQPYVFMYNATRKIAIHKRFDNAGMYPERPNVILNNLKLKTVKDATPSSM
ncbi:MAG: hypothetical protein IT240_05965 [Bacteroidia bacterium]|nr:hypothetical protein [Bacteroidia bacterium]